MRFRGLRKLIDMLGAARQEIRDAQLRGDAHHLGHCPTLDHRNDRRRGSELFRHHCAGSVRFTTGHHAFCWSRMKSAVSAGDVGRTRAPSVSNFCCRSG